MSTGTTSSARPVVSATRVGVHHRWSQTLIPTTREAPNDAETPSHVLLHRAGFIRQVGAGIYDYLPLAWRTLRKVSDIVREEMDAAGASEMLMPALEPFELFAGTKRDVDYGDNLFRLTDRRGRAATHGGKAPEPTHALAPTHEEVITELVRQCVTSYRALPLNLYQIQTKFRDEARPRAGLLRCREFIMKDAYSFHTHVEGVGGLNEAYDAMYRAYSNIFTRCGLDFSAVEAVSGPIGGSASHEFMVNCASGEDTILIDRTVNYAANVEKCEIGDRGAWTLDADPTGELLEVHTPNCPGIEDVSKLMKVKPDRMLKTIVFKVVGENEPGASATGVKWVVAVVRGDHEVNEDKAKKLSGFKVEMAPEAEARLAGFAIGYVSPRVLNSVSGVRLVIDHDAAQGGFWASGADKHDHHVKHFNWKREVGAKLKDASLVRVGDLRNALVGDPSPRSSAKLEAQKGIEVGHIFKLGTKYSEAMGLQIMNAQQQKQAAIMGCYGIGVSRTMAACVEMSHDENGIKWPVAIAPYHVLVVMMKHDDAKHNEVAGKLGCQLVGAGLDVLVDDRDERPGVKFKDADLVGIPIRITIGDKALDAGGVEFKLRSDAGKGEVVAMADVVQRCLAAVNGR